MKTVAVIQARMGSSRLPGKILADLAGEPVLARCYHRVSRATGIAAVVIATSDQPGDDPVEELCRARSWDCFRGSEPDVLDRVYEAAKPHTPGAVARITGDCPLVAPEAVDRVLQAFATARPEVDYASTGIEHQTWPRGMDVEVMRFRVLETAWREDADPASREHVTPFIYRNPGRFQCIDVPDDEDRSEIRLTVDTAEDLSLVRKIVAHFGHDRFSYRELLALLAQHPEWLAINRHVPQKSLD